MTPAPTIVAPTFTGPESVDVDGRLFAIPRGSRIVRSRHGGRSVVYVLAGERLHALIARGEVLLDKRIERQARERYFAEVRA